MIVYGTENYFEWLCMIVGAGIHGQFYNYRKLLERLYQTIYNPTNTMNMNRANDGKQLRYYYDNNRSDFIGYGYINVAPYHLEGDFWNMYKNEPCSILEMLIMFSKKIDSQYLYDIKYDRTVVWFWMMIENIGLAQYNDWNFDNTQEDNPVDTILGWFNMNARQTDEYDRWVLTVSLFRSDHPELQSDSLWEQMNMWYSEYSSMLESIDIQEYINYFIKQYN